MLTVTVDVGGLERKLDLMIDISTDLTPALRRIGGYLKAETKRRFAEQNFAPLAASTLANRASRGIRALDRKLQRDYGKAKKRAWDGARASGNVPRGLIARALARLSGAAVAQAAGVAQTRGVRNRLAVLETFRATHFKGTTSAKLTEKQNTALTARTQRAVEKAVGDAILGKLDRSPKVTVTSSQSVEIREVTHQSFSEVHNEGGAAGHGAVQPKRETLALDETDLRIIRGIFIEELLMPFQDSR